MSPQSQPDPFARILGHALVGGATYYVLRRSGMTAIIMSALMVIAHEAFDSPVTQKLADLGI